MALKLSYIQYNRHEDPKESQNHKGIKSTKYSMAIMLHNNFAMMTQHYLFMKVKKIGTIN